MKRAAILAVVLGFVGWLTAATPTARQLLQAELGLQQKLFAANIKDLEEHVSDLQEAWTRVDRLGEDMVRAEEAGESSQSLRLRDQDLREAEGELIMHVLASQRLRASLAGIQMKIEQIKETMRQAGGAADREQDPLTGHWRLVVEPGGLEGDLDLTLDGTLVTGIYSLSGSWYGSMRGTFVAKKVRLEQVDSQLGFAAVFYGRLSGGTEPRLEGNWEGTRLASGLPSGGSWLAVRVAETEESGYPEPSAP